jgi:hypothetical protein
MSESAIPLLWKKEAENLPDGHPVPIRRDHGTDPPGKSFISNFKK